MTTLTSTESIIVDLVALRNWHWHASMDSQRDSKMRKWHRRQAEIIGRKIPTPGRNSISTTKLALIEFLADRHRRITHQEAAQMFHGSKENLDEALAFEWATFLREAHLKMGSPVVPWPSNSPKSF